MNTLPLRRTVARSYAFAIRHFPLLVRVGWLWFLLALAVASLAPILAARAGMPSLAYLNEIVMTIAGAAVIVAWHRAIAAPDGGDRRFAHFGRRELRYLGMGIGMLVALYIPVTAMAAIVHLDPGGLTKPLISVLAMAFLVVAVSINRLILVFPGIALGLDEFGLRRSWELTAGNTWRLFLGVIVCSAPPLVIAGGLTAVAEIAAGRGAGLWIGGPLHLLSAVAMFVQLAVVGGFLSFVFEHFVDAPMPAPASAPETKGGSMPPGARAAKVA